MIRKQYFFHIHSLCCNTPIQFSFLQSWDICAAAEPIMLSLLCEDSYTIKILLKKTLKRTITSQRSIMKASLSAQQQQFQSQVTPNCNLQSFNIGNNGKKYGNNGPHPSEFSSSLWYEQLIVVGIIGKLDFLFRNERNHQLR